MDKIPVFTYWDNVGDNVKPPYICMCDETRERYLSDDFVLTPLNKNTIKELLPDIRRDIYDIQVTGKNKDNSEVNRLAVRLGILRVALLKKYGGVWLDSDVIIMKNFFKPIRKSLRRHDFIGCWDGSGHICNSFMISKPNSKLITDYWNVINDRLNQTSVLYWGEIGAHALTNLYKK